MFDATRFAFVAALSAFVFSAPVHAQSDPAELARQQFLEHQYTPVYADFDAGMRDWRDEEYGDAYRELKPLAAHGDVASQYYIGLMYHRGLGIAQDDAQAAVWLRRSAEQGYALAQDELGKLVARGRGVPADSDQARMWFRKAADQGLDEAQFDLGYWLPLQKAGNHRTEQLSWMRKAARQGNPLYQLELANHYGESGSGQQLLPQSAYWARQAADQGLGRAQYLLGIYYHYGIGVPKDDKLALPWLLRAFQQGSSDAATAIASIYDHGPDGGPDRQRAIGWYCKAAELQYGDYSNAISRLRAIGDAGLPCLLKVASAGNAVAQYHLGDEYVYRQEYATALPWLRQSAEQAYGFALEALGDLYARGLGVPRDAVLARMFYTLGDVAGSRIRGQLTGEQEAEAAALAAAWRKGAPFPENSRSGRPVAPVAVPGK